MSEDKRFKLIAINGGTNAGKNTLILNILENHSAVLSQVLSVKQRNPRPGEIIGKDYIQYTQEAFELGIRNDEFLEHDFYPRGSNLHVGTRIADVLAMRQQKKHIIKEMEPQGTAMALNTSLKDNIIGIFIDVPIDELKTRMQERDGSIRNDTIETAMIEREEFVKLSEKYHNNLHIIDGMGSPQEVYERALSHIKDHITL